MVDLSYSRHKKYFVVQYLTPLFQGHGEAASEDWQMFSIALIGITGTSNTAERTWHDWLQANPKVAVVGAFMAASGPMTAGTVSDSLLFIGHPIGPVITQVQIDDLSEALERALSCAADPNYGDVAA
jgi:hypothetical protein